MSTVTIVEATVPAAFVLVEPTVATAVAIRVAVDCQHQSNVLSHEYVLHVCEINMSNINSDNCGPSTVGHSPMC
jgi:hypothetical protein